MHNAFWLLIIIGLSYSGGWLSATLLRELRDLAKEQRAQALLEEWREEANRHPNSIHCCAEAPPLYRDRRPER
jgi:hypothetical protein